MSLYKPDIPYYTILYHNVIMYHNMPQDTVHSQLTKGQCVPEASLVRLCSELLSHVRS